MYPVADQLRDELLMQRVLGSLSSHGFCGEWAIDLTAERGVVSLRGRAPSAASKNRCLELCRRVPGIARLVDALEIQSTEDEALDASALSSPAAIQ